MCCSSPFLSFTIPPCLCHYFFIFSKKNSFVFSFVVFTETVYVFLSCSIFPLAWVIPLNKCQTYLLWDLLQDSIWQCISVDNQQNQHGNVWSSLIAAASPIRRAWRCDLNRRSSLKKTKTKIGSRQIVGDYYNFFFVEFAENSWKEGRRSKMGRQQITGRRCLPLHHWTHLCRIAAPRQ